MRPGRGCINAPPDPASFNSWIVRSTSSFVTLPFHTAKGAVRYSAFGSLNPVSNVAQLSELMASCPSQLVKPQDKYPHVIAKDRYLTNSCVFMLLNCLYKSAIKLV